MSQSSADPAPATARGPNRPSEETGRGCTPDGFHPAVQAWFGETFDAPTPTQRRGWAAIRSGRHALIAAPTGSGKTLAAFLHALDELLREGVGRGGDLPDETRVVYVSPLKALSADIHKNLAEPRRGIRRAAEALGLPAVRITAATRSGDTSASERRAMLRTPPHILVTTPESLYLLLTAKGSRETLRTARAVIVDEIHAVLESRRGSHLALSLERLDHVAGRRLQRIGLSATQKPIEEVARFLVGARAGTGSSCEIVDAGHLRDLDLTLELPGSPLEAVMSAEVWEEVFDRLVRHIEDHRTTLVFVNTRRLAERVARRLSERLGEAAVGAHHGSLAKETRLDAERRLKAGELKALVATASLELGIDIGAVDLVCQLGSPRRIATLLQRVGRSGHAVAGTPKGRLFPLTRDDLVECASLIRAVRAGELDRLRMLPQPLDVLAQQIVAEAACEPWAEGELFELVRRAWPYRELTRAEFDEVVEMVSRGYATRRGRRGALVHRDAVNGRLRGRRGARLTAITSGGAIPDNADYRVVLEPEGTFLGSVNEDFAIESTAGDIFQLGNASWRILQVAAGTVRVADARGQPPTLPFWLGEAPGRSPELSAAVAALRADVERHLAAGGAGATARELEEGDGLGPTAASQIAAYLEESRRLLGVLPTQETLVLERFFDESGGMQLVLHAPFGSRVNRAWGLALRKRFCQSFNFELQAAATEEAILLSLGPQHSFPLADVFRYLRPESVRETLEQAVLDAPVFQTRWRWNAAISLAVRRWRSGRRTPAPLQRMESEDLLTAVFPDALACFENLQGAREIPDHPLVQQALEDCLEEAMDLPRLQEILRRILSGRVRCVARDLPEPSPLAHEILNARPYAFLDDAPLEERRAHAVYARRALEPSSAADLGALDPEAIARVREEAWPEARDADELHDALIVGGFLREAEGAASGWESLFRELAAAGRAARLRDAGGVLWVAAERLAEALLARPEAAVEPPVEPPARGAAPEGRDHAVRELLRGRIEIGGPTTAERLAASLGIPAAEAEATLLALEAEGVVLRGAFTRDAGGGGRDGEAAGGGADGEAAGGGVGGEDAGGGTVGEHAPAAAPQAPTGPRVEWCDRRLLARIHRYTLDRLRAEIEPVSPSDLMRFLFRWQRLDPERRARGEDGLRAVIEQLDGFELAAGAWEADVLAPRCEGYEPEWLDRLCLGGRVAWGRIASPGGRGDGLAATGPLRTTPIALFLRESAEVWLEGASGPAAEPGSEARLVRDALERRGASFFSDLVDATGLPASRVERALGELVALGLATADGFSGLRALLTPSERRRPLADEPSTGRRRRRPSPYGVDTAGRWSPLRTTGGGSEPEGGGPGAPAEGVERRARAYLRRYGVVFRRLLDRETGAPPWRDLVLCYRRLEARGEIRGGRFVRGFSGEQFALPEAVAELRAVRRLGPEDRLVAVAAADPLNLTGIVTPGERIPAQTRSRIGYVDGVPAWVRERGATRSLEGAGEPPGPEVERAIARRPLPPAVRLYAGGR